MSRERVAQRPRTEIYLPGCSCIYGLAMVAIALVLIGVIIGALRYITGG